jgi:hypothetical protein
MMKQALYVLLVCATLALCAPVIADEPTPKPPTPTAEAPLTLAFAQAKPDPKACKALEVVLTHDKEPDSFDVDGNPTDESTKIVPFTVQNRIDPYLEDDTDYDGYSHDRYSGRDPVEVAQDQATLIRCQRDADGYRAFAEFELDLIQLAHKGASSARALAALDLAIQLHNDESIVDKGALYVRRAGIFADLGRIEDAYKSLQDGIDAGFTAYYWISTNARFAALHKHPEWSARFEKMLPPALASVPIPLIEDKAHDLSFVINEPAISRTANIFRLCKDHSVIYGPEIAYSFDIWTVGRWELKPEGFWVTPTHTCMRSYEEEEATIKCLTVSEDQDLSPADREPFLMLSTVSARLAASGPNENPFLTFESSGGDTTPEDADCKSYLPKAAPQAPAPDAPPK